MRKLTPEELEHMPIKGTGRSSQFYKRIVNLGVGEGVEITKQEYNLARGPGRICRYIMKKFPQVKYSFGKLEDGSGWWVKRVE